VKISILNVNVYAEKEILLKVTRALIPQLLRFPTTEGIELRFDLCDVHVGVAGVERTDANNK